MNVEVSRSDVKEHVMCNLNATNRSASETSPTRESEMSGWIVQRRGALRVRQWQRASFPGVVDNSWKGGIENKMKKRRCEPSTLY